MVPVVDDQLLAGAAVHSGFSASWQHALKQLVLDLISKAVALEGRQPSDMRVLITGQHRLA